MIPRLRVSAEDLERWTDLPQAFGVLPELVRRLLLATGTVRELEMRSGKAVYLKGFDGVLDARKGTAFCPMGLSVWEISIRADVEKKLDEDYSKRKKKPEVPKPERVVLMMVNAHRFSDKGRWMEQRNADRCWRRVRVLDADDLATWLEQAPLVAAWFAHVHMELPAYGLWDPERYLRQWSRQTQPALPPSLVLEGREVERRQFEDWLDQIEVGHGAQVMRIAASSRDEARIFALAALDGLPEPRRSTWIARCTVVEGADAWDWAIRYSGPEPWILVPDFVDDRIVTGTTEQSAHAVLPLDLSAPNRKGIDGLGIELRDPLPWSVVETKLFQLGKERGEAERIARETRGDLPALRLQLDLDVRPAWLETVDRSALVVMMLVGAWVPTNEVDARVVRCLGATPEDLDQLCQLLAHEHDAPIEESDTAWEWKSHATAWNLLYRSLTRSRRQIFADLAVRLLSGNPPTTELDSDDADARYLPPPYRAYSQISSAMMAGIAASLSFLGQRNDGDSHGYETARYVMRQILRPKWDQWLPVLGILSDLAEAAPLDFLNALETTLDEDQHGLSQWLSNARESSVWHILHVLQTLAWDRALARKSSIILIKLAACVDSNENAQPMLRSLYAIYNLAFPQTRLSDEERFQVVRKVVDEDQHRGWQLLMELVDGLQGGFVTPSPIPRLLPLEGIPTGPLDLERTVLLRRIDALMEIVIEAAGTAPKRWQALIAKRIHRQLHIDAWRRFIEALQERRQAIIDTDPDVAIWTTLREALTDMLWLKERYDRDCLAGVEHIHSRLVDIEGLYESFEPSDPVLLCAWLFYNRETFPARELKQDWESVAPILEQRRGEALEALLSTREGFDSISKLIGMLCHDDEAKLASVALENLARTMARSPSLLRFGAAYLYDDPGKPACAIAPYLARQIFFARKLDLDWLERLLRHWLANGGLEHALATTTSINSPRIWDMLDRLGGALRQKYWQFREFVPGDDDVDWERVVSNLLSTGNVPVAIHTASFRAEHLATATLFEALHTVSLLSRTRETAELDYDIERLLTALDARSDTGKSLDELAALELPLLEWLGSYYSRPSVRGARHVSAKLESSANYFTELVCRAYAPENATVPPDHIDAEPARRALHMWKSHPGSTLTVPEEREEALLEWARDALELTAAAQRTRAGQREVARILARPERAEDGRWPALAARELLESGRYHELGRGLRDAEERNEVAWWVADGGREEHERADRHEASSLALRARWPATADMLDALAKRHRREALRRDEEARRERLASGRPASTSAETDDGNSEPRRKPAPSNGVVPPSVPAAEDLLPERIFSLRFQEMRDIVDREYLTRVMAEANGKVSVAAERIGIGRTTLQRRLKQLGMHKPAPRGR